MNLFFCPKCHQPFPSIQICANCNVATDAKAKTYVEKLLDTVLSEDTSRMGMAMDVLTKWLHEPRAIVPLTMLLERKSDPYPLVVGARGLGGLRNPAAIPALGKLLLNESQPYVARVAAAEALGRIGGKDSRQLLEQAKQSPRSSVVEASTHALDEFRKSEQDNQ